MTIASEITRLQGAKADIRSSILGKGVTVPSSATLDEYSSYIDQITSIDILSGVSLNNVEFSPYKTTPHVTGVTSRNNGNLLYGLCCATVEPRDTDAYYYGIYTFRRIDANSDIIYNYVGDNTSQNSRYTYPTQAYNVFINGVNVRVFLFSDRAWSGDGRYRSYCYQFDWNTSTGNITTLYLGTGEYKDYNYANYGGDTAGYTQISGSSWVKQAVGNLPNYGAIYLVLK